MSKKKLNGKSGAAAVQAANPAMKLGADELLYRTVEQMADIANKAKRLVELYFDNAASGQAFSDAVAKEVGELIQCIHKDTRGMDTLPILSRMVVTLAAAAKCKELFGAELVYNKKTKDLRLKGKYGPGKEDFTELMLSLEVAKQLRDGLTEGINMIEPEKPKLILPNTGLIKPH